MKGKGNSPKVRIDTNTQTVKDKDLHQSYPISKRGLIVSHLVKQYGDKSVVNDLSFEVQPGEVVGLLGPNGAGKTTAFYMVIGLIKPDSGSVIFNGEDISVFPMHERAKRGLGYLPQEPSIFRELTVEENIIVVLELMGLEGEELQKRLEELLGELHLTPLRSKKGATLSGGERRRLEITRALATQPSCLMLDEPFANIDPIAIADLKAMITLLKNKGISILITDHNAREIISIADKSYLIADGKVIFAGSVEELVKNEEAKIRYFGQEFFQ